MDNAGEGGGGEILQWSMNHSKKTSFVLKKKYQQFVYINNIFWAKYPLKVSIRQFTVKREYKLSLIKIVLVY